METREGNKFVRYRRDGTTPYGILDGERIDALEGDPFGPQALSGEELDLADVELLAPCSPSKVIAVGLNYRSHLGHLPEPEYPGLFAKYPTCIVGSGADIVIPVDARDVHYEGELVVVIGATAKNVAIEDAAG